MLMYRQEGKQEKRLGPYFYVRFETRKKDAQTGLHYIF